MIWRPTVDPTEEAHIGGEDYTGSFDLADTDGDGLAGWSFGELDAAVEMSVEEKGGSPNAGGSEGALGAVAVRVPSAGLNDCPSVPDTFIQELALKVHPVLVAAFLDSAPGVFNPGGLTSTSPINVQLICAAGQIAGIIYGALIPNSALSVRP